MGSNLLENADSWKNFKKEMKTIEAALLGAAKQAQVLLEKNDILYNIDFHIVCLIFFITLVLAKW